MEKPKKYQPKEMPESARCAQCHRIMAPDEIGDELPDERVCDKCAERFFTDN